jgi:hypothetical protein
MSVAKHFVNIDFRSIGCHYAQIVSLKSENIDQYGYCIVCSKCCTTACAVCGVSMRIEGLEKKYCFYRFYTMKKFTD